MQRSIMSLSVVFVMALTLTAAGGPEQSADQNKATIRRFYEEVFNAGKIDLADQYVTADALDHEVMPGQKDPIPALANLKEFLTEYRKAFPDLKVQIEDLIAEGDKVVARIRITGTQKGDFQGAPPTGKSMSVEVIDMMRLVDGKIVEHWGLADELSMMQQLGMTPPAPGADTGGGAKTDNK
jgi:steroid delta-isomerase-like uncharacterized protein